MSFKEPEALSLFPNPFLTVRVDDSEALNRDLLKEITKRRDAELGIKRSNQVGWHSATDFFQRSEPAHARLAADLAAIVAACTAKMMSDAAKDMLVRHEGWVNVNPTNALNAPHDHPGRAATRLPGIQQRTTRTEVADRFSQVGGSAS